jgi:ATP-binding cassette subfamily C (CFTR/MRP) protein 10
LIGASLLAMQASKNLSDAWLSKWTLNSTNEQNNTFESTFLYGPRQLSEFEGDADREHTRYYLTVFISLAGINTIFTLCRAFLFAYGGVVAAKNLHSSLLRRVLRVSFLLFCLLFNTLYLVFNYFLGCDTVGKVL